jgi:hypothetical protein
VCRKKDCVPSQRAKDPHADGQKDFTEGKYDPPHSIAPVDYAIHSEHTLEKIKRETISTTRVTVTPETRSSLLAAEACVFDNLT